MKEYERRDGGRAATALASRHPSRAMTAVIQRRDRRRGTGAEGGEAGLLRQASRQWSEGEKMADRVEASDRGEKTAKCTKSQ